MTAQIIHIEALANEIKQAREQRKALDDAIEAKSDELKAHMGELKSLHAGKYLVVISERTRTDLDKRALTTLLGDQLKQFEKKTTYQILEIK